MIDNKNPQQNDDQPKMPRFNMNWIYTMVIIGLVVVLLWILVVYHLLSLSLVY